MGDRSPTVSEARAHLPALVQRVQAGEEITLTRHGRPVVTMVRPDALRIRRADAALSAAHRVQELVTAAGQTRRSGVGLTAIRADELVEAIRSERSRR